MMAAVWLVPFYVAILFYAGLVIRHFASPEVEFPFARLCVGGILGVISVFIGTAELFEGAMNKLLNAEHATQYVPAATIVLGILQQGYIWPDAQKFVREKLLRNIQGT